MVTWPVCVNPNFSKRIIGRASSEMASDLISAVEGGIAARKRRRKATTVRGVFVIVRSREGETCWKTTG